MSNQSSSYAKIQLDVNKIMSQLHLNDVKCSRVLSDVQNPSGLPVQAAPPQHIVAQKKKKNTT